MVREYGTPTLFLTLSCAEYESPDIIGYLRSVNNVPQATTLGSYALKTLYLFLGSFPRHSMPSFRKF